MSKSPYFFLAYAHSPEQALVRKLFEDLCTEIRERTDVPLGSDVGFMDVSGIPVGGEWRPEVLKALATCQVFLPLYSPRYFSREECGQEWYCFAQRMLDDRARRPGNPVPAIVPALWTPVNRSLLPEVAQRVQADHERFGRKYADEGFYTLIKNSLYEQEYITAIQSMAQHIIRTAEASDLAPSRISDFGTAQNVFAPMPEPERADRRLTVVVAAPTLNRLPPGRRNTYYGSTATDWNPWYPNTHHTVGTHAAAIAHWHNYRTRVISFDEEFDVIRSSLPEDGLGLVLIDAWASEVPETAHRLETFDQLELDWIGTLVPLNRQDPATDSNADRLWHQLTTLMPKRLGTGRFPSAPHPRVRSPEQLRSALPLVLERSLQAFLGRDRPQPPDETYPAMPRLGTPSEHPRTSTDDQATEDDDE